MPNTLLYFHYRGFFCILKEAYKIFMVRVIQKKGISKRQKEIGGRIEKTLKSMNRASEEQKAQAFATELRLPYIDLNLMPLHPDDVRSIPVEDAKKYGLGVFYLRGREARIGLIDPTNEDAEKYAQGLYGEKGWTVQMCVISKSSFDKIIKTYERNLLVEHLDQLRIRMTDKELKGFEGKFGDILALKERIKELPTSELLSVVFAGALKLKASDIHFEPQENIIRLRYRLDGVLHDIGELPVSAYKLLVSRIKMLTNMKLNIRDRSQDGHFSLDMNVSEGGGRVDVRVAIIPGRYGENVVARLLHQGMALLKVEDLGLRGHTLEQVMKQVNQSNGMVLNTGPTGSGKTTTLYAFINGLNDPERKIITIENPIEYEIKGIAQTEVNEQYTFSQGLRAIVRQDPDVILVGEIRDDETADIALNAALTGHLVLSTVHTNSAVDTIPRLVELGIKPSLIGPAVNVAIAQRLVRRLCENCREQYAPAESTTKILQKILAVISSKAGVSIPKSIETLYRPVGCEKCNYIGYKGQIGIFEALIIDGEVQAMIEDMRTTDEILHSAIEKGMVTMAQDGILKSVEGITSIEEVWRVVGHVDFLETLYEQLMEQTLGRALFLKTEQLTEVQDHTREVSSYVEYLGQLPTDKILPTVFAGALFFEAGDIHIEPERDDVRVRFRIDGILQDMGSFAMTEYPTVLGQIKTLSGFKSQERLQTKDGRFSVDLEAAVGTAKDEQVDIRVSFLTGGYGETIVARLLNKSAIALDMRKLGIREQNLKRLLEQLERPNGFFCNTGPTGSGKSTTLYSMLAELNKPEVKIMTVEDPIEYRLQGILQTQVNAEKGYTFSTALRTLLRQNPDIIMVGEIRDNETAQAAAQAALTGHLVFSTLHTNNAIGSITRLLNVGVRADDLAELSNAFMAQRLVRMLCTCKKKRKPTEEEYRKLKETIDGISSNSGVDIPEIGDIYEPVGCEKCRGIGYKGRSTVSEVLTMDSDIREAIARQAMHAEIEKIAIEHGMITMEQDGALRVIEGTTSLEEVGRVTEL